MDLGLVELPHVYLLEGDPQDLLEQALGQVMALVGLAR